MARKDREIAELITPGRLDKPIIVLRKVDVGPLSKKPNRRAPSIMERIGSGYIEQGVEEKETTWFLDGYIINDQPRMAGITDEIMANTLGFALANTETGEIIREGGPQSLVEMTQMADGAKLTVSVDVEGIEDEDEDEDAVEAAAIAEAEAAEAATEAENA